MNKLLIIEREPSLRLLYAEELMEEGFEVITSDDAQLPDLIAQESPDLMVWGMDIGKGKTLMKTMRVRQVGLSVIFELDHIPLKSDLPMEPNEDYFIKSSDLEELKTKIKKLLNPQSMVLSEADKLHPSAATVTCQLDLNF
jgi:DNA-binding response OmpR family regulator